MFTSINYEEGLKIAKEHNLKSEYNACMADDMSVEEALQEWDLI